jgi:hypothetical protein
MTIAVSIISAALLTWFAWLAWQHDRDDMQYDDSPADENDVGRARDLPLDKGKKSRDW